MRYFKKESLVGHFNINLMLVRLTNGWLAKVRNVRVSRPPNRKNSLAEECQIV